MPAHAANMEKLSKLAGPEITYVSADGGQRELRAKYGDSLSAPSELPLRLGAQVMLLRRLRPELVSGSIGIVVGFESDAAWDMSHMNADLGGGGVWPLVRFVIDMEEEETADVLLTPLEFTVEGEEGQVLMTRLQVRTLSDKKKHGALTQPGSSHTRMGDIDTPGAGAVSACGGDRPGGLLGVWRV